MKSLFSGLALAASMVMFGSAAQAAVIAVTYKGVVTSGYDGLLMFGSHQDSFIGASFSATLVFDDAVPGGVIGGTPSHISTFTCTGCDAVSPATLGIGGTEISLNGLAPSSFSMNESIERDSFGAPGNYTNVLMAEYHKAGETALAIQSIGMGFHWDDFGSVALPYQYDVPMNYVAALGKFLGSGSFAYSYFDKPTPYSLSTTAVFAVQSITSNVTSPAAVPEPASWAIMIAGFFGIGIAARHRRMRGQAA